LAYLLEDENLFARSRHLTKLFEAPIGENLEYAEREYLRGDYAILRDDYHVCKLFQSR
jgi:hypothetical protein